MNRRRAGRGACEVVARALAVLFVLLIEACATRSVLLEPEGETVWDQRQARLGALERWTLQGRVAIETARDGGTATLRWEQDRERYAMRIIAPLGQGTFELRGDAGSVTLRTPENQTLTASDPQALMQENLGWSMPVDGLQYWVRGLPAPGRPARHLRVDEAGRLRDLEQDGWRISLLRYTQVAGLDLPDKLYMENNPLRMRLVIGEWQLPDQ